MKAEKYRKLMEVHMLHRIWRNELELALQEVNFWEELFNTLSIGQDFTEDSIDWQNEVGQLHHFRRLCTRLLEEIKQLEGQLTHGVQIAHVLDADTRLNHQYIREAMDSFHTDFRRFKTEIRQYLVEQFTA
ncbi:hypothetical protein GCM10028805_26240 [Spirosoma harenae]